jgi:hypothetical protein
MDRFFNIWCCNTTHKANLELFELVVVLISWIKISYLKGIHDFIFKILIYINHLSKLHCDNMKYIGWNSIINLYFDTCLCILEIDIDLLHGHMHIDADGNLFIFTNMIFNVFLFHCFLESLLKFQGCGSMSSIIYNYKRA